MASEKHNAPVASDSSDSDVEVIQGTINEKKLLSFLDRSNGATRPTHNESTVY